MIEFQVCSSIFTFSSYVLKFLKETDGFIGGMHCDFLNVGVLLGNYLPIPIVKHIRCVLLLRCSSIICIDPFW